MISNFSFTNRRPLITEDLNTVDGLAVDWMAKNMYWTDSVKVREVKETGVGDDEDG